MVENIVDFVLVLPQLPPHSALLPLAILLPPIPLTQPPGSALSVITVNVLDSNLRRGGNLVGHSKTRFKLVILVGTAAYIGPRISPGHRTLVNFFTAANQHARIHYR